MEKIFTHSDIHIFTQNIIKNNKNAYVFDFTKDIDIEKSGYYELNKENNCLIFLYQKIKELKPEDFYVVSGEIQPIKEGFKLVTLPETQDQEKQKVMVISKDPINLEISDSLYITHERNDNTIYMSLVSKYFYEQTMRLFNKEIIFKEWEMTTQTNSESIRIVNELRKNNFLTYKKKGNQQGLIATVPIVKNQQEFEYLITFGTNCVLRCNRQNILLNNIDLNENNSYHLFFAYHSSIQRKEANIKNLELVNSKGYVYLNPIANLGDGKSCKKIKMLFTGDVKLQYYSDKHGTWKQIEDEIIGVKEILQLRLEMTTKSKVHKIIIYEDMKSNI